MSKRILSLALPLALLLATPALAQGTGTVTGTVTDENGTPLPGVQLSLEGEIPTRVAITDSDGRYTFADVPAGSYAVVAFLQGFTRVEENVEVAAGSEVSREFTLVVAASESITVTGSFLASQVLEEGRAPIDVIDASDFTQLGIPDFEETIRNTPEMLGAENIANQYTGTTYNIGMRQVNLRGLGSHRNLVLFNGRRSIWGGYGQQGFIVDIAAFPRIAMKRIEVLKESTPVYGSDAITGVFNYMTNDDFVGLKAEVWYNDVQGSDGGDKYAAVMKGWQVGRLNLVTSIEYSSRDAVRTTDLDWFVERTGGLKDNSWPQGQSSFGNPGGFIGIGATGAPSGAALRDPACGVTDPLTGADSFPGASFPSCSYYYTTFVNFIEPQERFNLFTQFTVDLERGREVYGHALFTRNDVRYTPSPTYPPTNPHAFIGTASTYIPPSNPGLKDFVAGLPPEQAAGFAGGAIFWGRPAAISGTFPYGGELTPEWPRRQNTWQLLGGTRGTFNPAGEYPVHYDFALSWAETNGINNGEDILTDRMTRAHHGLGGPNCDPVNGTPGVGGCEYWNPFYSGATSDDPALRNSPELFDWLLGDTSASYNFTDLHFYADFSGSTPAELPGGPLSWAGGYEFDYNENSSTPSGYSFADSPFDQNPFSFLWLNYPFGHPIPESSNSHAVYGELLLPFANNFSLNLAARYNDVPWLDETYTQGKASIRWEPVDSFMVRASFSQGVIIPTVWDLEQDIRFVTFVPAAGEFIPVETPAASKTGGLDAEESDTYNLGFVWHPTDRTTVSVDRWQIDFSKPIVTQTIGYVLENLPDQVVLRPDGRPSNLFVHRFNGPDLTTSGFDIGVQLDFPTSSAGLFTVGADATYLDEYLFEATDVLPEYDALGKHNGRLSTTPVLVYATPELKYSLRVEWNRRNHAFSAYRHFTDSYETQYAAPWDRVDSFVTYDVYYNYRLPFGNTTLRLNVVNLTDEAPPVLLHELAYDAFAHNPLGRMMKIGLGWEW